MFKPLCIISACPDSLSGYGKKSRDIIKSLIKLKGNEWDIQIISMGWGSTPLGALDPNNIEEKQILDRILTNPQLQKQPDVWIQITIPSEFQTIGKTNILFTSGIETTISPVSWIEGVNKTDLTIVCSEHAKNSFLNSKYEKRDQKSKQLIELTEVKKPIEVLFEGIDLLIFNKLDKIENDILSEVKESFCFLTVGTWLNGSLGQDRKDIGGVIKTFLETFKGKRNKPALILKTNGATYSSVDKYEIINKINSIQKLVGGDLPNIYLIHGELTDNELNELYNNPKVKSLLTFTKGEGFGRPLLEASLSQKLIVASDWSGHLDFLQKQYCVLLPGKLNQVDPSAVNEWILKESSWFSVNYETASNLLEDIYLHYNGYIDLAKRQAYYSKTNFSLDKMTEKLDEILKKYVDNKIITIKPINIPKINVNPQENKTFQLPKINIIK